MTNRRCISWYGIAYLSKGAFTLRAVQHYSAVSNSEIEIETGAIRAAKSPCGAMLRPCAVRRAV